MSAAPGRTKQARAEAREREGTPASAHAEAVRLAALQTSWRRDRSVARRRLAVRWFAWAFWRYGLPVLLVLGTAACVAAWIQHAARTSLHAPRFTVLPTPAQPNPAGHAPSPETLPKRQEP